MTMDKVRKSLTGMLALGVVLAVAPALLAQTDSNTNQNGNMGSAAASTPAHSITSGEKMHIKGVVSRRDADTFTVRDANNSDTIVRLTDSTSIKTKGGFLHSGTSYGAPNILRGLSLEVEGRGDGSGQLVAEKIRFNDSD